MVMAFKSPLKHFYQLSQLDRPESTAKRLQTRCNGVAVKAVKQGDR